MRPSDIAIAHAQAARPVPLGPLGPQDDTTGVARDVAADEGSGVRDPDAQRGGAASAREARKPGSSESVSEVFRRFAHRTSCIVGTPGAFLSAVVVLALWAASGPVAHFSDTWQLIINTGTTIITFLMVFLIQSTQNRDASAIHLKLDELIRATRSARNDLVALEHMTDHELAELEAEFEQLRTRARTLRADPRRSRPPRKAEA